MCQIPISKLQIQVPGLNVSLNFQVTAAATATTSQELSQSGKSPDPSRAGTKYPVQGIPHFDDFFDWIRYGVDSGIFRNVFRFSFSVKEASRILFPQTK